MAKVRMPLKSFLLFSVLLVIFYWVSYHNFDQPIAYFFHNHIAKQSLTYHLSDLLDSLVDPEHWVIVMILVFIYCFVLFLRKKSKMQITPWLISAFSLLVAFVIGTTIKYTLARYRPEMLFNYDLYGFHFFSMKNSMHSTPSGHALANFAGLLSLALISKRTWVILLAIVVACIICFTRLLVCAHFLSDVVFGGYIGIFSMLWVRWFISNHFSKL